MVTYRVDRVVDAPAEVAWTVLAEPGAISAYAGNISRAETDGEGEGMHRRCWDHRGNHWDETCRTWVEGDRYAFEVHTETSGSRIHQLFSTFTGSFGVETRTDGTVVWAAFELEPKWGPVGEVLVRLMGPLFRRGIRDLLDSWAVKIESRAVEGAAPA